MKERACTTCCRAGAIAMPQVESPAAQKPKVDARIRAALGGLRRRIRIYVVLHGLAAVVVWLGVTFWAAFALDYLPVLVGASEMPRAARAVLLTIISIGAAYVAYRWLLNRLVVPLTDRSMAILLERRHRSFRDSLVTTVELTGRDEESEALTQDMLAATGRQAVDELQAACVSRVFNFRPLLGTLSAAGLLVVLIAVGYATSASAMTKAARRLYLLDNELWERFARIEILGVEVRRPSQDTSSTGPQALSFEDGQVKVARGSNVTLRVQADANALVLPEQCYLSYRTAEGDRGTVTMKRVGRPRDDQQLYTCDAKPLAGILSSLDFDVLGYDHRLSGYRIEVVESPTVVGAKMDLRYPAYMVDETKTIHVPRQGEPVLSSGNPLPLGTNVTLHITSSKPLAQAEIRLLDPEATDSTKLEVEQRQFEFSPGEQVTRFAYEIPALAASRTIEVSLLDTDGVAGERPYRAFLTAVPDEAPRWELAMQGIGTAVTPDVIVPLVGKVTDDYGVHSVWLDTLIGELEPVRFDVPTERSDFTHAIDFRLERSQREEFRLQPGDKLALVGRAVDRFDLAGSPNEGISERFVLEVVTPDQLLVALEARELALRRRFEVVVEELTAMRDSLLRIKPGEASPATASEPDEVAEPGEKKLSPQELARREAELRTLRAQRAFQQSKKSAQEIQGVAQAFDGIREELTNNRVDTQDRKSRLKEQIADPLHAIVAEDFPALDDQLLALEPLVSDAAKGPAAVEASVARSNELLAKLDQVLQKMLKLESYNEIVDLVRDLIKEQSNLIDDTKRQQRRDLVEE